MNRVLVFGCGDYYRSKRTSIEGDIVGYIDNFKTGYVDDIKVYKPEQINDIEYDWIYVLVGIDKVAMVLQQLINLDVPAEKIIIGQNIEPKLPWEQLFMSAKTPLSLENGLLFYNTEKVKVCVKDSKELYGIIEMLYGNEYGYELPFNNNVVIDIGLNIGLASLYFASRSDVYRVYAYEPFSETYEEAISNIKLNPLLSDKIIAINAGLSNRDKEEKILYNKNVHGALTTCKDMVEEMVSYQKVNNNYIQDDEEIVEVKLLDAQREISKIIEENKGCHYILKVDCEGSEYGILEELDNGHILNQIDCIMLEWHYRGSEEIEKRLIKNGFGLHKRAINEYYGLIYAFRFNC